MAHETFFLFILSVIGQIRMRNFILCLNNRQTGNLLIKGTILFFSQTVPLLQSRVESWEMWKVKMGTFTAT